jgi:hypothetical protein
MIVSVYAIIDGIGGVEGKVSLEEGITKIVELTHRVCLITFLRGVQFWALTGTEWMGLNSEKGGARAELLAIEN